MAENEDWNKKFYKDMYDIDKNFYYSGDDLGVTYSKEASGFRIWAPTAKAVSLNLYQEGLGDNLISRHSMMPDVKGTYFIRIPGDLNGIYYTYCIELKDSSYEVMDPYAKAAGANGERGMVIDFEDTNPKGWTMEKKPVLISPTDAVIYEMHIRDLSASPSGNIKNIGKFLGLTERNTKNREGLSTGLDHMKELGITHLHLMPSFDYGSVDETRLDEKQFNWGYDPKNYNVIEGSYSTDPYHGEIRIKEFKEMVKTLHEQGIRVILDVVYNHTELTEDSNFNKIVPNYYYRMKDGMFTNGSGCGNEIASERSMVRKYIIDSVVFWAKEYHLDGFRFDLMGLHDIETMNEIRKELDKIDESILIYGEGWAGGVSILPNEMRAHKENTRQLNRIAVFSDDIRDSVKGSVFDFKEPGFVSGKSGIEDAMKFGIVGAVAHEQVREKKPWAVSPEQSINYVSSHDDLTLWDKLTLSAPDTSYEERVGMNKMAAAIIFTSQGIPFFQAGEELLRTKPGNGVNELFDSNSFKSSDEVNSIKWDDKTKNYNVFKFYKGLIAFRKAHPSLRMRTQTEIQEHIKFLEDLENNVVAFHIRAVEKDKEICVIHNGRNERTIVTIPVGTWDVYVNEKQAGLEILDTITNNMVELNPISSMVLVKR